MSYLLSDVWTYRVVYFPEYDIDPTTPGFDWTKSKHIRPTNFVHNLWEATETILQKDAKIADLEKELKVWRSGKVYKNEQSTSSRQLVSEKLIDFWAKQYEIYLHRLLDMRKELTKEEFEDRMCQIESVVDDSTELYRQAIERIEKQ